MTVNLETMDAEVHEYKSLAPLDHIRWPTLRTCMITKIMYEKLMKGEDIEAWIIINYHSMPARISRDPSNIERHEVKRQHAANIMYCLDRHERRNAYRLAILASVLTRGRNWLAKDGDHCIATRIGQCLGWHFQRWWIEDMAELFEWPSGR